MQQGDPGLRDGDAGADQRLPPGVLRLPAVQPQVRDYVPTYESHVRASEMVLFPSLQLTAERRRELPPFLQRADAARDLFLQYREREREREERNSDELNTCR